MSQSEFEIIRRYFAESGLYFPRSGVELGIGDDGAVLQVPTDSLLTMSMDILVEGVHFPLFADPAQVAHRALAVNLSDLAAMAADPFCFTLGLVLPDANESWLAGFSEGLLELAQDFKCPLVGGDITRGPLSIAIQVHGLCKQERVLRRDGAKVGDLIYVTGTLGDGAIALASLGLDSHLGSSFVVDGEKQTDACKQHFHSAYYRPKPRIEFSNNCADFMSSGIDVSDGLVGDLGHVIKASGVGAVLNTKSFPYSNPAACCVSESNRQLAALFGGDDYELCVSVPALNRREFEAAAESVSTQITCIGEIVTGSAIRCLDSQEEEIDLSSGAYMHFRGAN
jgi:thiamine-monophosphate kinase